VGDGKQLLRNYDRPLRWAGAPTPDWVPRHARVGRLPRTHTESVGALFFRQPSGLILKVPAQAGYGDKWPSQ